MNKCYLMLLFGVVLFKANSQPGSLDSTFGKKGIQTTAFFSSNIFNEEGREVLTSANGNIFVVVRVEENYTRIARYLPDGRLDSFYGIAGFSSAENLGSTSVALQGDKIIMAGSTGNPDNNNIDFTLVRFTAEGALDISLGRMEKR